MKRMDLTRYIKDSTGTKVEMRTTSLNLELKHVEFLKSKNLNLSLLIREYLDELIKSVENSTDLFNETKPRRNK